jgi:hypothetical protein
MVLSYLGDALWVLALTVLFAASRQAARRIPPGVRAPILGAGVPRGLALWALPTGAFLLSLWLLWEARRRSGSLDLAVIVFGVRASAASLLALLHLRWLGAALKALGAAGALKP